MNNKLITNLIYKSISEINVQLPPDQQLLKEKNTILFGKDGKLDSLGLVNLIVIIEQNVGDEFDANITIADERALSQKHSPFKTVGTLTDYIKALLEEI